MPAPVRCLRGLPCRRTPILARMMSQFEFVDPEDGHSITVGRAEAWREEYQARVERHRAEIRAETDRLGWSFIIHRTDRPARRPR